jgi:glycosyltransferase involved in cell wall biosynthesis
MIKPIYSICVTNKNMEKTIEKALSSVLDQLDDRFEMIVVDESTDKSREVLKDLEKKYPRLRSVFLEPNRKRTIADARNISVSESAGEYCLLHIDCDDIWEPYLLEFLKVFHFLEKLIPRDFLLAGQQVNMGKRDFLLLNGPYRNGATGEDRDMWMRLAKQEAYFPLNHVPFFSRMPLPSRTHKSKALIRNYFSAREGFRGGTSIRHYLNVIFRNPGKWTSITRIYNLLILPFAFLAAMRMGKIDRSDYFENIDSWNEYKSQNGGTLMEIARRFDPGANLDFLSREGKWIFGNKRYEKYISQMVSEIDLQ